MKIVISGKETLDKLLPCPKCGKKPNLTSLEPEYRQLKYFCSTHIPCGDWRENEELATNEWNKRVNEYLLLQEAISTPGTPQFLQAQAMLMTHAYCQNCDFETGSMPQKDLFYELCMAGGYTISDKHGGYTTMCPNCESKRLKLVFD